MIFKAVNGLIFLLVFFIGISPTRAQSTLRWNLIDENEISWSVSDTSSHIDHIELSGFELSSIIHYGIEKAELVYEIELIFPQLRTIPNDTHASLSHKTEHWDFAPLIYNGRIVEEKPIEFSLNGTLQVLSQIEPGVTIERQWFPSIDKPALIQKIRITNNSQEMINIEVPELSSSDTTISNKGVDGSYAIDIYGSANGQFKLESNSDLCYFISYSGRKISSPKPFISPDYELKKRSDFIQQTFSQLKFISPDDTLNTAFAFAKLRATESIYNTKGGLMHGPGGGRYYAAIWANDQAEYANPFFPFLGNLAGNESAINSFRHFAKYINPAFKPIPSSIIAEGTDFWNGAGDRGDMAMIAYGAARFALAYGDKSTAKELWPLIEWCLEYCRRQKNDYGVVQSDCDELEFRFPAGNANLNTSCLYYDALLSSAYLGNEINIDVKTTNTYIEQSKELKKSIEQYFGREMSGYETYRYFDGNNKLRAWICTPLTVGILDRVEGTIDALFSEELWTKDGLASEAGDKTFWDRATLYALRGVFAAGKTEKALDYLKYYSARRLMGDHVPYPVEAYPEGNQRHLSAESALYCRIFTEGLFGIRPTGFNSFTIRPRLPKDWDQMSLAGVHAFQNVFDIDVQRIDTILLLTIKMDNENIYTYKLLPGESINIKL